MTDRDSLAWGTVTPRRCRRHEWVYPMAELGQVESFCIKCRKLRDPETSRRGRNNRSRGNAIERAIGAELGLKRGWVNSVGVRRAWRRQGRAAGGSTASVPG